MGVLIGVVDDGIQAAHPDLRVSDAVFVINRPFSFSYTKQANLNFEVLE